MSRTKGSKNKTISKAELINNINNITPELEQKALPPSFGKIDSLLIAPKTISNNPVELIKLNKGYVGSCNQKNATSIASTPLRLFAVKHSKNDKIVFPYKSLNKNVVDRMKRESKNLMIKMAHDVVEITEHPVFELLNQVNDDLNYYDLMEMTAAYCGLIGNAYWHIEKEKNGLPKNIRILPAEYTCVTLDDTLHIKGYRLFNGVYQEEFKKEDVIHFKNTSPGLFWRVWNNALMTGIYGMGDLEYVLDEVYLYNSINDYLRALTENNAIPAAIIKYTGGRLDKNTMQDVQQQWDKVLRTWKRAGKTKVMDQDFDFVPISMPPKDLEFGEGRKWLRGVICNGFGVPEDLVTTENSNRASSSTAVHHYMRYTILPKLKRLEERLNSHLITLYDDNLFFEFDSPVPGDVALTIKQEEQDLKNGVITINEVRAQRGLLPVEWGNSPIANTNTNIDTNETNDVIPKPIDDEEKDVGNT